MRYLVAALTLAFGGVPAAAQQAQELEQIRKQLDAQKAQNDQLKARLDAIEAGLAEESGAGFWTTRPDGQVRLHEETPWADGNATVFNYLADDLPVSSQDDDRPIGLYYGSKTTFAEFHGFTNVEYHDFGRDGRNDGRSTFDVHNFFLSARAEVRSNILTFAEIHYEHGNESEIRFERAYIEWTLARELQLQFGLRFAPFGIRKEMTTLSPLRNSNTNPAILDEFVHQRWPIVGAFAGGTLDVPLEKGSVVDYTIGIINGESGLPKDFTGGGRDNNPAKTAILNVGFSPFVNHETFGSLRLGFSHLFRSRYSSTGAGLPSLKTQMTGANLWWDYQGLNVRAEYVRRRADDDTVSDPPDVIEGNGWGYYVEAAFDVVPRLTTLKLPGAEKDEFNYIRPFVRFNRSDTPITGVGFTTGHLNGHLQRWDVGVQVSPYKHIRFGLEYDWARENDPQLKNNGILLTSVLDF